MELGLYTCDTVYRQLGLLIHNLCDACKHVDSLYLRVISIKNVIFLGKYMLLSMYMLIRYSLRGHPTKGISKPLLTHNGGAIYFRTDLDSRTTTLFFDYSLLSICFHQHHSVFSLNLCSSFLLLFLCFSPLYYPPAHLPLRCLWSRDKGRHNESPTSPESWCCNSVYCKHGCAIQANEFGGNAVEASSSFGTHACRVHDTATFLYVMLNHCVPLE
jgi:hypothetical protein